MLKRSRLKRTKLRRIGTSETALSKKEIQRLLREIVIKRDKVCQRCGIPYGTEGVVFQCDHLMSRSHSANFSDSRLVVLVCKPCHAWKSLGSNLRKKEYDDLMRAKLPKERVALWDRCEEERWKSCKKDWALEIVALIKELSLYSKK